MDSGPGWNSKQLLLETSFWDSGEDSEPEDQEELGLDLKRKAVKGEIGMEGEDVEEDSETELDSDDEGIGSMNSAGQNEGAEKAEGFLLSEKMGRRGDFYRGRKGRTLARQSVGGLLNQLKRSLQSRGKGGGEVFGLPLAHLLDQEGGQVPNIVLWATSLIEARGPEAWEGIYRLSGQATTVAALKNSIQCGRKPKPSDAESIHSVAALLKVR